MSFDPVGPELIAAVAGGSVLVAMFGRLAVVALTNYFAFSRGKVERLELTILGREYSVDLNKFDDTRVKEIELVLDAVKKARELA